MAIASCGVLQATEGLVEGHPDATARIVAGLMTGIGLIGGGAILKDSGPAGSVQGTATTASLWAPGGIGASVALGSYDVAVVVALATVLTLRVLVPLKEKNRA